MMKSTTFFKYLFNVTIACWEYNICREMTVIQIEEIHGIIYPGKVNPKTKGLPPAKKKKHKVISERNLAFTSDSFSGTLYLVFWYLSSERDWERGRNLQNLPLSAVRKIEDLRYEIKFQFSVFLYLQSDIRADPKVNSYKPTLDGFMVPLRRQNTQIYNGAIHRFMHLLLPRFTYLY